jgi:hypothetical protein
MLTETLLRIPWSMFFSVSPLLSAVKCAKNFVVSDGFLYDYRITGVFLYAFSGQNRRCRVSEEGF